MHTSSSTSTRHGTRSWIAALITLQGLACSEEPQAVDLKAQRAELNETIWADERLAQEYEQTLVALWDSLLDIERKDERERAPELFAALEFDEITLGAPRAVDALKHGIEIFEFSEPLALLDREAWGAFVHELATDQITLIQSEWHHAQFEPATSDAPARSKVSIVLHLIDASEDRRIAIDGSLGVEWSARRDEKGNPIAANIDATGLRMMTRSGPAAFERVLSVSPKRRGRPVGVHPVLIYDVDQDGLSDIILVNSARILRNEGRGKFRNEGLVAHPYALTESGVVADMNGDAHPDFMSTRLRGDIVLYTGDAQGRFFDEPTSIKVPGEPLKQPSVLSVGDVDGDGDLDLWVAQYKLAYREGQFPSPFYDANDGYPAYLLLNDGHGNFTDVTEEAGLAPKRFRRTYTSTFVDFDGDADLDLLVVSDFSGIDIYRNDGSGHFEDISDAIGADRHLFGMSATFGDFNLDGRLDFFVAGMSSTTARRLEALNLNRDDRPDIRDMRMRMAWGNRMYLASNGGWVEPEFKQQVARTGWTWGTSSLDFDNDGDIDIFAGNGHQSGESTNDYCTNFWCHDIFDGKSEPTAELSALFEDAMQDFTEGKQSWDGYQKNHLLMNRDGKGFINVAFLLGVADQFDTRSALSEDLDADGLVDLVVVEDHGAKGQKLHVYRNRLQSENGWVGVRLVEEGGGISPVGAAIVVRTPDREYVQNVLTGETLMGQHSTTLHFGLGRAERIESIEVRWINGSTRTLDNPDMNRYHSILSRNASDAHSAPAESAPEADRD